MTTYTKQRADLMRKLWKRWFDGISEAEFRPLVDELCEKCQAITDREIENFINRIEEERG